MSQTEVSDTDYCELSALLNRDPEPERDSPEGKRIIELSEKIEAYEKERYPFRKPSRRSLWWFRLVERYAWWGKCWYGITRKVRKWFKPREKEGSDG